MPHVLEKLRDPGWTPGRKDVRPLLEALAGADEEAAEAIVRILAPVAGEPAAREALAAAPEKARPRFVALLGRIAKRDPAAIDALVGALDGTDAPSRKAAARALGKLQDARVEPALLAAFAREARPEVKRALVEALGRAGGEASRAALAAATDDEGDELGKKLRSRAALLLDRTVERTTAGAEPDARDAIVVPATATVVLRCREGLEELLRDELGGRAVVATAGAVRTPLRRGADELMASRLWTAVTVPVFEGTYEGDVATAIAERLRAAKASLLAWTGGRFRFRLSFRDAGHRRAVVFRVAELLADEPALRNDPHASPWELEITDRAPALSIVAVAKKLPDPRFAWRVADVPAASHPTLAAALALVGAAEGDDVVWDPFVGSGLELVERARFGGHRVLVGTDLDERALAAARKNLESAGVERFELALGDARSFTPAAAPTLVLTNPPMGRRVQGGSLDDLLAAFLRHVADVLRPGGRFVWLTPRAKTTDRVLAGLGLERTVRTLVDMGGFTAELQRWDKPKKPEKPRLKKRS